jgi:hypothetical protein
MEILEDAALPCTVSMSPGNWDQEDAFFDSAIAEELVGRGLVISLPCEACLRIFQDDHCRHLHLTARGIEALHFYRDNKELLT